MLPLRTASLIFASVIVASTAQNNLDNIHNVVVLVQENRYVVIYIASTRQKLYFFLSKVHLIGSSEISPIARILTTSVT